jgi:adenylate cyclase
MDTDRASRLVEWLLVGSRALEPEALLTELAERIIAAGIPLQRSATSLLAMHPEVLLRSLSWSREDGCVGIERGYDIKQVPMYLDSPVAAIHQGADEIACRLDVPEAELPFPTLAAWARGGGTGYCAVAIVFADGRRTFASWTTDRPGGFTEGDLALFRALVPALSIRLELASLRLSTQGLLRVYLGRDAAERVLRGAFQRGTGEVLRAAIWFCDLRDFTAMGDAQPVDRVVTTLDQYFEHVAGPVVDAGGEILKFIGDAMLAIFPVGADGPRGSCERALAAAKGALAGLARLNDRRAAAGEAALSIGVALHLGEVMYGNIGARDRLDFTVIGAPVNEVCRVEALCKTVKRPLLCTAAFASALGGHDLVSLGKHALKGVSEAAEIFAPR